MGTRVESMGRRVLVLGSAEAAGRAALERFVECDVTLCSRRGSLDGMSRELGHTLRELAFEDELTLWLCTDVRRVEALPHGRFRVWLGAEGTEFSVFDDVVDLGRQVLRPAG